MLFCYCVALLTAFEHCLAFIVVCCSSLCMNVCIYVCVMVGCIHMTFTYLAHACEQIFCLYCSQAIPFHHLLPLLQCRIMLFGSCKDWCLVFSIVACCKNFIFSKHEQQKHSMCVWALAHMVASVIKEWYLLHQQFTAAASEQTHMLTHTHPHAQIYVYICTHTHAWCQLRLSWSKRIPETHNYAISCQHVSQSVSWAANRVWVGDSSRPSSKVP